MHVGESDVMQKEIKQTKDDAAKGEKVNYERNVNLHQINENTASIGGMLSCVEKARQFRANAKDVKKQDIRKFEVMR